MTFAKTDPGVELQVSTWGGGGKIPFMLGYYGDWYSSLVYQNGSAGPEDTYWAQTESQDIGNTEFPWEIVTTAPDTGTHHLKTTTMNGGGYLSSVLYVIGFKKCDHVARRQYDPYWVTTAIRQGQTLTVKVRARFAAGSGSADLSCWVWWLDYNGHLMSDILWGGSYDAASMEVFTTALTGSYATMQGSVVAARSARYALVTLEPTGLTGGTTRDVYVDNVNVYVDDVHVNSLPSDAPPSSNTVWREMLLDPDVNKSVGTLRDWSSGGQTGSNEFWVYQRGINTNPGEVNVFVSTVDPQKGPKHITMEVTPTGTGEAIILYPCRPNESLDGPIMPVPLPYATRWPVVPGRRYRASLYTKPGEDSIGSGGNVVFLWFDKDHDWISPQMGAAIETIYPPSGYQQVVGTFTAPADAAYLVIEYPVYTNYVPGKTPETYVDTFSLMEEIVETVETESAEPATYQLSVQFEGNALKGYAGTYPLPARSGPTTLELTCVDTSVPVVVECLDPTITGTGFYGGSSAILAANSGGLAGNELPRRIPEGGTTGTRFYWNSTGSLGGSAPNQGQWGGMTLMNPQPTRTLFPYNYIWQFSPGADVGNEADQSKVTISTANPYKSARHIRVTMIADTSVPFTSQTLPAVYAAGATACTDLTKASSSHQLPLWRVDPGDVLEVTYAAMTSTTTGQAGGGGPFARPYLLVMDWDQNTLAYTFPSLDANTAITTTYKTFTWSVTAPAAAYWAFAYVGFHRTCTAAVPETYMDLAEFEVTIT